jgi:hypothetical protein
MLAEHTFTHVRATAILSGVPACGRRVPVSQDEGVALKPPLDMLRNAGPPPSPKKPLQGQTYPLPGDTTNHLLEHHLIQSAH